MILKQIMQDRYATKKFTGELISEQKISELKEMIRLAPSSFGLQPFRVKVVSDKDLQVKLQEKSFGQVQVGSASHILVFCADAQVLERIEQFKQLMLKNGTPEEKAEGYSGMIHGMFADKSASEVHLWASEQAHIALAYAVLGAKELGFDSCPMGGFDAGAYKELLDLPSHLTPVVICPVRIAADTPRPKQRFDDLFI